MNGASRRSPPREWFPGVRLAASYQRSWLPRDLLAGIVLASMLVPAGMGYAEASGLPAINGLYATIAALAAYSLLGPSRVLILGPDSSLVPIVAATVIPLAAGAEQAVALAAALSLLAGLISLAAGLGRLGFLTDLISMPIRVGYLNGIALTLLVSQLPKLFGFAVDGRNLVEELGGFVRGLNQGATNLAALALGAAALTTIVALGRTVPRLPALLIAVAGTMLAVAALDLQSRGVEVVGPLPAGLPIPQLPSVALADLPTIAGAAAAIALISLADSSVLSRVLASREGRRVDPDQELVALGGANIASGLLLGMPVSASNTRTPVAEAAGAKTALAGLTGGIAVAAVLLFAPRTLATLPSAALAAVVISAALRLVDLRSVLRLGRTRRVELGICLAATAGVALLGPIDGVGLAVTLAVISFLWNSWRPHWAELVRVPGLKGYHDAARHPEGDRVPGLVLFRFDAPLFFANADLFRRQVLDLVDASQPPARWVVVTAEPITDIDATAAEMLGELLLDLEKRAVSLRFAELKGTVRDQLDRFQLVEAIGSRHFYRTVGRAVRAYRDEFG